MTDINELAFQVCRYMFDNRFTSANYVTAGAVQKALNLTSDDFNVADDYLRERRYYDATRGGDNAQLSLKASGIDFVNRIRANRLDLSMDAEQLATYLANKQTLSNNIFTMQDEIKADLQWNDEQYLAACQLLSDEGLLTESPTPRYMLFKGLLLNVEGRKAVRRNFRRNEPVMNVNTGNISIENSNGNVAINNNANNNNTVQNIQNNEITQFFEEIIKQVEKQQDLSTDEKESIKDFIELAQKEAKEKIPDEKKLASPLQNIAMMAPDVLDVAIAAASAPIAGPLPLALVIAKKVSEKAKAFAQKKTTK